jgi:hypothetical protein
MNGKAGDEHDCKGVIPSRNCIRDCIELPRDMKHTQLDVMMEEDVDRGLQDIVVGRESLERVENVD